MKTEVHGIRWVVMTADGRFLCYVGGDWGPDYMTTAKLDEATLFDSMGEAEEVSRHWSHDRRDTSRRQVELIEQRRLL